MKSLHGSGNRGSCPDDGLGLLPVAAIGRGIGSPVRIHPVRLGFSCIRTRSRTICPDSCKTPTWNQESRQESRQVGGIGLQKTRVPGIPTEIPIKRLDSAITVDGNPESRHFSML